MKWEQQIGESCLAYALWSIGAITKQERDEYVSDVLPHLESVQDQMEWVNAVVPWAAPLLSEVINKSGKSTAFIAATSPVIPANGTGVLSLRFVPEDASEPPTHHAMAYAAGKVLDPDGPGTLETWGEFSARALRDYSKRAILLSVAPKKRSRKA